MAIYAPALSKSGWGGGEMMYTRRSLLRFFWPRSNPPCPPLDFSIASQSSTTRARVGKKKKKVYYNEMDQNIEAATAPPIRRAIDRREGDDREGGPYGGRWTGWGRGGGRGGERGEGNTGEDGRYRHRDADRVKWENSNHRRDNDYENDDIDGDNYHRRGRIMEVKIFGFSRKNEIYITMSTAPPHEQLTMSCYCDA
jgi:hypothetical protein